MLKKYFLLIIFILNLGIAQDLSFQLNASSQELYEYELVLDNINFETAKLGLRFAANSDEKLEFGLKLRQVFSYGPVGNIVFSANSDFSSTGLYDLSASAAAVIADVAAEAKLGYYNATEGSFNIDNAFDLGSRPSFPIESVFNFDVSAKYKLDRNTILSGDYDLFLLSGVVSNRLKSELSFTKVFGRDGLGIEVLAFLGQQGLSDFALLGGSYELRQKALPTTKFSLRLGVNNENSQTNVSPGLTISMNKSLRSLGAKWGALLWLEPYRTDLPKYRAKFFYEQGILAGKLTTSLYGSVVDNSTPLIASLKYKFSF